MSGRLGQIGTQPQHPTPKPASVCGFIIRKGILPLSTLTFGISADMGRQRTFALKIFVQVFAGRVFQMSLMKRGAMVGPSMEQLSESCATVEAASMAMRVPILNIIVPTETTNFLHYDVIKINIEIPGWGSRSVLRVVHDQRSLPEAIILSRDRFVIKIAVQRSLP